MLTHASLLLSETLAVMATLLTAYAAWRCRESAPRRFALGTALALGLLAGGAAFVRPALILLGPAAAAWLFFLGAGQASERTTWRRARAMALAALGMWLVLVGGWMLRNHAAVGVASFSHSAGYNLLLYRAAGAMARDAAPSLAQGVLASDPAALEAARERLLLERNARARAAGLSPEEAHPAALGALESELALETLWAHPRGAALQAAAGFVRMMLGVGATHIARTFHLPEGMVQRVGAVAMASAFLLAIVGWWVMLGHGGASRDLAWLCVFLATAVLLVAAGEEAYSRFRIPATPFLVVPAGVALTAAAARLRRSVSPERPCR